MDGDQDPIETPPPPPTSQSVEESLARIAENTRVMMGWVRFFGVVYVLGLLLAGMMLLAGQPAKAHILP